MANPGFTNLVSRSAGNYKLTVLFAGGEQKFYANRMHDGNAYGNVQCGSAGDSSKCSG